MTSFLNKAGSFGAASAFLIICFSTLGNLQAQEQPRSLVPSLQKEGPLEPAKPLVPELPLKGETVIDRSNLTDSLVVESLDALNPATIGLLGETEGGFGSRMWKGTSSKLVATLVENIPYSAQSPQMKNLYRRLLLTGAILSGNGADAEQILDVRLQKLRDAGLTTDALLLLDRLPRNAINDKREKIRTELYLLQGKDAAACLRVSDQVTGQNKDVFWAKMAVFCKLLEGDFDRAELGAALLEEQGENDSLFFELFAKTVGDTVSINWQKSSVRPLHIAMIRKANVQVDYSSIAAPSREITRALVRDLKTLDAESLPLVFSAMDSELMDAHSMRSFYGSLMAQKQGRVDPDLLEQYGGLFQAATAASDNKEKAAQLLKLLQLAMQNNHFEAISKFSLKELVQLPPTNYGREFNFLAVKSLLLNGRKDDVIIWEKVIRRAASQGTVVDRLKAREDVINLDMYMILSGTDGIARWNSASFSAWLKANEQDPELAIKAEYLLSMLEVFGYSVGEADWKKLLFMKLPLATASSNHALENNLVISAHAERLGETVALVLQTLGHTGPKGVTTTSLIAASSALKAIGFEAEARNLAVEAAIAKKL